MLIETRTAATPQGEAPSTAEGARPNLEMYAVILNGIHGQIRFADAKAGFVAALNAMLFGFLAVRFDDLLIAYSRFEAGSVVIWFNVIAQSLYLTATATAVCSILMAVMPRFSELAPHGKMFFRQIVRDYGTDCDSYVRETSRLTDQEWATQIGTQIVEISHIAAAKHQLMRKAVWWTLIAFVLWRITLIALALLPAAQG